MANTFSQLYIQFVFSVKGRENMIKKSFKDELEKVICGIILNHKCKPFAVYCNADHVHVFVSMSPILAPSKLMEQVKSGSSKWLNEQKYLLHKFSWQEGYGAFSYSKSHVDNVVKYIENQEEHHKKRTFREEYLELLNKFEVEYDEKYLFEWYE